MIQRIIDVNLNRICEALRLFEDLTRFYLMNESLTKILKKFRHNISNSFLSSNLILYRNIRTDKTKFLNIHKEFKRKDLSDIITANAKRMQESARVLEEILKLQDKRSAGMFKSLRFFIYDLEQKLILKFQKSIDLSSYHIIEATRKNQQQIIKLVKQLMRQGLTALQIKCSTASIKDNIKLVQQIRQIKKRKISLIIHNRIDIAVAADADGIHLDENGLSIQIVRKKFNYLKIIGRTETTGKAFKQAIKDGYDYIIFKDKIYPGSDPKNNKRGVIYDSVRSS